MISLRNGLTGSYSVQIITTCLQLHLNGSRLFGYPLSETIQRFYHDHMDLTMVSIFIICIPEADEAATN